MSNDVDVLAEIREMYGRHSNKTIDAVEELIEAASDPILLEPANDDNWKKKSAARERLISAIRGAKGK